MEIGETLTWWRGRFACRVLHLHGLTCRGRRDHSPYEGHWVRNRWL